MIKLKILKKFNDRYTGELYTEGLVIEVSKERANELLNHKLELVEVIKDTTIKEDDLVNKEIEAKEVGEDIIVLEAKPKRTRKTKTKKEV